MKSRESGPAQEERQEVYPGRHAEGGGLELQVRDVEILLLRPTPRLPKRSDAPVADAGVDGDARVRSLARAPCENVDFGATGRKVQREQARVIAHAAAEGRVFAGNKANTHAVILARARSGAGRAVRLRKDCR